MSAPHDQTYALGGQTYFDAPMPAWAKIGQRFDELSKAYYDYQYGPEHFEPQRELITALQLHLPSVQADPGAWVQTERDLQRRFTERYTAVKHRLPATLTEYLESGQMPAGDYLEWLILEARSRLAGQGDPETDWGALEVDRRRLTERLTTSGYTTRRDREMQQEDPARYAFLQKSMSLFSQQMQNPADETSFQQMLAEQVKLFQESPYFAQAEQQMDAMLQGLESLKQTAPELYEQQRGQMDAFSQLYRDPAAAMKNLYGNPPELPEDVDAVEDGEETGPTGHDDDVPSSLPPGVLRFACSGKNVTAAQRKLFESLQKNSQALLPQIEKALRDMHAWMNQGPADDPREAVLFPSDAGKSDVPLQVFSIERVELDPKGRWAILWLDTLFPHFDEHACGIRIEGDQVTRYGTWDEVCGDEEFDE